MNGRIYDPLLGRFLSADIMVDGSMNLQGYNRYSYVHNNPLQATDPSGFTSIFEIVDKTEEASQEADPTSIAGFQAGVEVLVLDVFAYVSEVLSGNLTGSSSFDSDLFVDEHFRSSGIDVDSEVYQRNKRDTTTFLSLGASLIGFRGGKAKAPHGERLNANEIKSRKADGRVNSKKGPVVLGETGEFGDLQRRSESGDGLDIHESPSRAATEQAFVEQYRRDNGGADPSPQEIAEHRKGNPSVAIPRETHSLTDTYKGRNTKAKSATDAADLDAAAERGAADLLNVGEQTGLDLTQSAEELIELHRRRN